MTEEVNKENVVEQAQEVPEFTEVEEQALSQGWIPKEEYQGEAHKWVAADEFLRRGELFSKIDAQSRELKNTQKALLNLQEHYTKVKETEYNRALAALKQEIKTANREGDFDKADRLETEIESIEREATSFKNEVTQVHEEAQQLHPEFAAWVQKNNWYATQKHMRTYADDIGLEFKKLGLPPQEVLKKVEDAVKKEFPNKFVNPNRDRPGMVEGSTNKGNTKKDEFVLNEQEARVMQTMISQKDKNGKPFMTKDQYIADLKRIKGIKE